MLDNGLKGIESGMKLTGEDFRDTINAAIGAIPTWFEVSEPLMIDHNGHEIHISMLEPDEPVDEEEEEEEPETFWAEITASSGTKHTWSERRQTSPGSFASLTDGRSGALNAYDANGREDIPSGTIVRMHLHSEADQTVLLYGFDINHGLETSLATLGVTSGDDEDRDATTWNVESQGNNKGVTVTKLYRMAYDASGDEKLYAFYRNEIYDSNGQLLRIEGEQAPVAVATPVDCP
tara:strand:+ start:1316 stop:2020 length:705 start_codon:yes stop_codon:yes gene_type:complete